MPSKSKSRTPTESKLALLGGNPVGKVKAPLFPQFSARAKRRVLDLLDTGHTVGLGKHDPIIREAEDAISRYHGGLHCLGTSSGHGALQMALAGLEIGPGDEVITTPYSWGASISCILHQGAIPIFADVDPKTGLIDPATIEALITKKTRAILAVHIFGQPAPMPRILKIAAKHGLAVIEDGSQAHGATLGGKKVGGFGHAAGFSCMGGKLLATTEAGYLVTRDEDVYWKAALLSQHMGRSPDKGFPDRWRPYVDSLVYTYRLNPINAVLLTEQLKKLDREIDGRRQNVESLRAGLADAKFLSIPKYARTACPSFHLLTMNFNAKAAGISRLTFLRALNAEGLPVFAYVPAPIPDWHRLHWKDYKGPRILWMDALKQNGVDYAKTAIPNCRKKIASSVEMGFNFVRPDPRSMQRAAEIVLKVESHINTLRAWEKVQA
ncbi:MAG: DegT/DnrJ/EryC1/StrS family aminotransferase [Opitutaceae bacterium]